MRRRSLALVVTIVWSVLLVSSLSRSVAPELSSAIGIDARLVGLYQGHLVELLLALVAMGALGRSGWSEWGFTLRHWRSSLRYVGSFAVLYAPAILIVTRLITIGRRPSLGYAPTLPNVIALVMFESVFVGVAEELLFRGFAQSFLARTWTQTARLLGREIPVVVFPSAIVFTLAHVSFVPFQADPVQLGLALVVGLAYSLAYARTRSLLAPVLMHDISDGLALAATYLVGLVS